MRPEWQSHSASVWQWEPHGAVDGDGEQVGAGTIISTSIVTTILLETRTITSIGKTLTAVTGYRAGGGEAIGNTIPSTAVALLIPIALQRTGMEEQLAGILLLIARILRVGTKLSVETAKLERMTAELARADSSKVHSVNAAVQLRDNKATRAIASVVEEIPEIGGVAIGWGIAVFPAAAEDLATPAHSAEVAALAEAVPALAAHADRPAWAVELGGAAAAAGGEQAIPRRKL